MYQYSFCWYLFDSWKAGLKIPLFYKFAMKNLTLSLVYITIIEFLVLCSVQMYTAQLAGAIEYTEYIFPEQ